MNKSKLDIERTDGKLVLHVMGELDLGALAEFTALAIDAMSERAEAVEVDLAGVTFIDSSGVKALGRIFERVTENGGTMTIANPQSLARRVLELSGLTSAVDVVPAV